MRSLSSHLLPQDAIHEGMRVKLCEVISFLARTYKAYRNTQFLLNGEDDAAFRRAIEFSQNDPTDLHRLLEVLGLANRILSRGGIQNKQRFMWCIMDLPCTDRPYLLKFLHQVELSVQPSGCVDHEQIGRACFLTGSDGVENNRAWVRARRLCDDIHSNTFAPNLELVDCCRAKSIRSRQHNSFPRAL